MKMGGKTRFAVGFTTAVLALLATAATAQDFGGFRGRGDRDHGYRGRGDGDYRGHGDREFRDRGDGGRPEFFPGGPGPGGYSPSHGPGPGFGGGPPFGRPEMSRDSGRSSRYEFFLQRMDSNNDGTIDPAELDGPAKPMFEGMARRAGLDPSKPISVDKVREAMMNRSHDHGRGEDRDGDSKSGEKGANQEPPLVPGFGLAQSLPVVPGFGVRVAGASVGGISVAASTNAPGGSSSSTVSEKSRTEYKVREYAKGIIAKYDRNHSGSLERDEWGQMKSDPKDADRNNDGVVTEDELVAKAMKGSSQGGSSGLFASGKSYRFVSPTERLPEGLPDWFTEYDGNSDGQVAMHEFARVWSDSTAQKFCRHDLNNDGVITPEECLDALDGEPAPETMSAVAPGPPSADVPSPPKKESSEEGGFWWMQKD